jgi:hypothetical protein
MGELAPIPREDRRKTARGVRKSAGTIKVKAFLKRMDAAMKPALLLHGPGLCACGCGQATKLARANDASKGYIKGQPMKFVHGHHVKTERSKQAVRARRKLATAGVWR